MWTDGSRRSDDVGSPLSVGPCLTALDALSARSDGAVLPGGTP